MAWNHMKQGHHPVFNKSGFSVISRDEYKNWTFWLVEKLIIWRYIHLARASLLSSPSFNCQLGKLTWRKVAEWSFHLFERHHSKYRIFNRKDGEFSKWLLSPLDQKSFQELAFKAFKNRERSGCVGRQQVRSIDRNLFFFKLKLLILGDDDNCEWSQ